MDSLQFLLKELEIIRQKYEAYYQAQEKFNIFTVLHKQHDERRLHSRFISALLSPEGSHRLGNTFLNFFLEILGLDQQKFQNAVVYPKETDKKEFMNMDIFIWDKINRSAIIIENKIFATDSNTEESGQLERYFKEVNTKLDIPVKNIYVFYLTLDGHEPSQESLGSFKSLEAMNGRCISYGNEIKNWLERSLSVVAETNFLRDAIIQYKKLIQKMVDDDVLIKQRIEIRDLIGKNTENLKAAKMLYDNFIHVKWHTVWDFWNELAGELKKFGFEVVSTPSPENVRDMTHFEHYRMGQKKKQDKGIVFKFNEKVEAVIWNDPIEPQQEIFLYWGIRNEQIKNFDDKTKQKLDELINSPLANYKKDHRTYFKCEFFENEDEKIKLTNFHHIGTFNLIDNKYRQQKVKQIVEKIYDFKKQLEV